MAPSPLSQRAAAIQESPTLAVTARARSLREAGTPVIGFGAGEPDFSTPAHIVEAARRACSEPASHHYSPTAGQPALRRAVAEATGPGVTAEMVTVTNGGKHALFNVFQALLDPGDEVLLPAPYWVSYPEQIRLAGGVVRTVGTDPDTGFRASVERLEAARTRATTALVFVSPSNPTGVVYPPDEVAAVGRWAADHGLWIVADEIYEHLVYGDARHVPVRAAAPGAAGRTVVVNGVSKAYAMTGWRVGWSVAPPGLATGINRLQSHATSNVNNVAQAAALAALTGPQDAVASMREAFDRRRRRAVSRLRAIPGVTCVEPEGAFYVFPDLRAWLDREVAGERIDSTLTLSRVLLEEAGVAVVPGEAFGAPGFVRLSYALADDRLDEGLERLAGLLG